MPKVEPYVFTNPRNWVRKYPKLSRLFCISVLLVSPILFPLMCLWAQRDELKDAYKDAVACCFRPWRFL